MTCRWYASYVAEMSLGDGEACKVFFAWGGDVGDRWSAMGCGVGLKTGRILHASGMML